jgi:hypothetical protein
MIDGFVKEPTTAFLVRAVLLGFCTPHHDIGYIFGRG